MPSTQQAAPAAASPQRCGLPCRTARYVSGALFAFKRLLSHGDSDKIAKQDQEQQQERKQHDTRSAASSTDDEDRHEEEQKEEDQDEDYMSGYESDCDSCYGASSESDSEFEMELPQLDDPAASFPEPASSTPKGSFTRKTLTRPVATSAAPTKVSPLEVTIDVPVIPRASIVREQQLGFGASGTVFRAKVQGQTRPVALKVIPLPPDAAQRDRVLKDVYVECHIMSVARGHPNVVNLLGVMHDPEQREIGILTELCDQGDVLDYLTRGQACTEGMVRQWMSQVAAALSFLHQKGIQHRDIKPENIFLATTSTGAIVAKIGDFGLSRLMLPENRVIQLGGDFACTDIYAPPEVLRRQVQDGPAAFAADMWGLGLTMFIMLGGYHPFDKSARGYSTDMRARVLAGAWNFDEAPWRQVSFGAADFIAGLLRAEPSKRLSSAQALNHFWMRL